ncbi:RepB family plasmid replication initiator protein [Aeromonas salmonicida]|uniref:RepB family plasmid replication initiator protein n=1 Tax=Aeromonas salmonicida TaxID=645 RepID=UPI00233014E4|nr:RepB family plasmid replication initiator protein [Aeromonas salmonicida]WCH25195.1 protein RepA [Aeromonas salmonicida]
MNRNTEESDGYTPVIEEGALLTTVKHDSLSTVHPNIILRTQVFTPIARNPKTKASLGRTADVSDAMRELIFAKNEGYDRVVIYGAKLDIETDFRVWGGIALAFEKEGFKPDGITLSFKEFASLCGFPSRHLNTALRERLDRSLTRIMSQVISFGRDGGKATCKTHLLQRADYNQEGDWVRLVPDPSLWELYQIDYNILLSIELQESLRRKEVAQCLYMFIAALPKSPAPISFTRLRERVALAASKPAEANRSITNALAELKKIGYLDYEIVTKNRERYVLIHERHKRLKNK